MTFWHDSFLTAFNGLRTNKSRSGLTILGIVIGIAAIILIMAVGQGAQELILDQVRGLGSQTVIAEPGREPTGPSDFAEVFTDSLKLRDVEALKNPSNVQGVKVLAPAVIQGATVDFENETLRVTVFGTSELIEGILELFPEEGSFFNEDDVRQKAHVAVIGYEVKQELFGSSDALGEKIKIKGRPFRIVGIFPQKGQGSLFNIDHMTVVPYTTAQQYLLGINYFNSIFMKAETEAMVPRVVRDVEATLREMHNIDDPDKDDFHVITQADVADRIQIIMSVLTALLISVAAISLVVGGIGIMNIMLVSVSERTSEIGLRKALGATERDILMQFLLESVMLTGFGGILGIAFGALFSWVVSFVLSKLIDLNWVFSFSTTAALLGLGVSALIGLVFGIYPASQAARKSPMEALRHE